MTTDETPKPSRTTTALRWIIGVPAGIFALICIAGVVNYTTGGATKQARNLVAYQLRDPSSAQFRDVFTHNGAVCGQVNSKNGFGAYAGFARFYVSEGRVTFEPQGGEAPLLGLPSEAETFDLGWRINCGSRT